MFNKRSYLIISVLTALEEITQEIFRVLQKKIFWKNINLT